jgi:hypothetical protein
MMEERIQEYYRRMFQQTVFADETEASVNLLINNMLLISKNFDPSFSPLLCLTEL